MILFGDGSIVMFTILRGMNTKIPSCFAFHGFTRAPESRPTTPNYLSHAPNHLGSPCKIKSLNSNWGLSIEYVLPISGNMGDGLVLRLP